MGKGILSFELLMDLIDLDEVGPGVGPAALGRLGHLGHVVEVQDLKAFVSAKNEL